MAEMGQGVYTALSMLLAEELRRISVQVVALGAEMVVDHVKYRHQAARMRGRDQALEIVRGPVARVGRERQHAVVAPVARARKIGDRHDFDRGHAESDQIVELLYCCDKGARRRESSDVKLIDYGLFP